MVEACHEPGVASHDRARVVGVPPMAELPLPVAVREMRPASVLALQRTVGNRATLDLVRRAGPTSPAPPTGRQLARCAGACSCGGKCKQDELLEDEMSGQIRRAVARRVVPPEQPDRLARARRDA